MTGKLLGASALLASALWTVLSVLSRQRRQTALLRELAAAPIRWQRRPLPEAIAAMERYPLAGPYFRQVGGLLRAGKPLNEAWQRVFSRLSVGGAWMTALELSGDEEKLTDGLLYTARQLKACCRRRSEGQRQSAKLWAAGMLSAAGLLIILLI